MSDYATGRASKRARRDSSASSHDDIQRRRTEEYKSARRNDGIDASDEERSERRRSRNERSRQTYAQHDGSVSGSDNNRNGSGHSRLDRHNDRRQEYNSRRDRRHSDEGIRRRSRSPERHNTREDRHNYREDSRHEQNISRRDRDRDRDRSTDRTTSRRKGRDSRHHKSNDRRKRSPSPLPYQRSKVPLPSQNDAFTSNSKPDTTVGPPIDKQKPNFGLTGKLAAASNTVQTANQTIVLKYHEPSEARKPPAREPWRMYVFKDDEILDTVELSVQSCWLFGREAAVADYPIEHPSCSKQHAVIQFRYIEKKTEFGDKVGKVKPYLIDLESSHGTSVNGDKIPEGRYVELRDKDMVKFGSSTREYVVQLPPVGA